MIDVRAATPTDAMAVARVHVRAWQVAYRGVLPQAYLDGLDPEDRMSRYAFDRTGTQAVATLVAVDDGVVRGFATTGPSRDDGLPNRAELRAIYVDPSHWGSGVGPLLITAARLRLQHDGFREAILWVLDGNERACRFYEMDGWRADGVRRAEEIGGVALEMVRYRRALS